MRRTIAVDARDAVDPQLRGWGRYAACLVDALPGALGDELLLEAVYRGSTGPEALFEQVVLPWRLRRAGTALIHATNCFLPLVRPCPGVVTIHDLAFEAWRSDFSPRTGAKYRWLVPRVARSAERIICPSRFTADDIASRYGIDRDKVRVIPEAPALPLSNAPVVPRGDAPPPGPLRDAPPPGPLRDAPPHGGPPYVVAVGDLRQKKNLGALVSAFAGLWRQQELRYRLVLAGVDSGQGHRLRELAGEAPVELTGYVSDQRLDSLIRGADLLVNPSLYEGFGLVVLEAMVRGTPVLAAKAGSLPEAGGEAAAYFDPDEPEALRAQLESLMGDPDRRTAMSDHGRSWAAGFTWERTARETVAVYRELL